MKIKTDWKSIKEKSPRVTIVHKSCQLFKSSSVGKRERGGTASAFKMEFGLTGEQIRKERSRCHQRSKVSISRQVSSGGRDEQEVLTEHYSKLFFFIDFRNCRVTARKPRIKLTSRLIVKVERTRSRQNRIRNNPECQSDRFARKDDRKHHTLINIPDRTELI